MGPPSGMIFSDPFGYMGISLYRPRYTYDNWGNLIENTDFDIKNPDLSRPTSCFGVPMNQLWHAGEDEYDSRINTSQGTTAGADVKAVSNGLVKYAADINYPGSVVIIEHGTQIPYIYSVYSHLLPSSVSVNTGQQVSRGQYLGDVMKQDYVGLYPQYHLSGDDSHLHFEICFFYDASNIYTNYPNCNGITPGRGYTYPEHPTVFPSPSVSHYYDPTDYIWLNQWHIFLPFGSKN